jgi:hypothetical protein
MVVLNIHARRDGLSDVVIEEELVRHGVSDWWQCMPLPLSPKGGYGMNVAVLLCFSATFFTISPWPAENSDSGPAWRSRRNTVRSAGFVVADVGPRGAP